MDIKKTNAARILDRQKIQYELIPYKVDENDLGAQHVADSLGEDINQVFKTILVHGDKIGYLICVVPGNLEVDLKGAAKVSGNKKIDTVPLKAVAARSDSRRIFPSLFTKRPCSARSSM